MATPKAVNHQFFATWSPQMAYVLGFFAADGNMIRTKAGGHYIGFRITDQIVLQIIQQAMQSEHAIGTKVRRNPREKIQYSLQIGSRTIFEDLQKLGMSPVKSRTLSIPLVPNEFVGHFVRGYFDGDGCVYFKSLQFSDRKNPRWILQTVFTSGSRLFLEQLHALLKQYGVHGGSLRTKARGFDLSMSHRDSLALYRLMYDTIATTDLYLPRKRTKFTEAIGMLYPDLRS